MRLRFTGIAGEGPIVLNANLPRVRLVIAVGTIAIASACLDGSSPTTCSTNLLPGDFLDPSRADTARSDDGKATLAVSKGAFGTSGPCQVKVSIRPWDARFIEHPGFTVLVTSAYSVYHEAPEQLSGPVTLTIRYDPVTLLDGTVEADFRLARFADGPCVREDSHGCLEHAPATLAVEPASSVDLNTHEVHLVASNHIGGLYVIVAPEAAASNPR